MFILYGPYLDMGRNLCVRAFLHENLNVCTHLLLVDSDVEFTPQDVVDLTMADKPVITGVYHNEFQQFEPPMSPVIFDWGLNQDGVRRLQPIGKWDDGWPIGGTAECEGLDPVVPVTSAGAGFLLLQRCLIERMRELHDDPLAWFHEPVMDGYHLGEDHGFFLRCADDGYQPYAHRGVQVAHHKEIRFGGQPRPYPPMIPPSDHLQG
jgi:hypothetical protein